MSYSVVSLGVSTFSVRVNSAELALERDALRHDCFHIIRSPLAHPFGSCRFSPSSLSLRSDADPALNRAHLALQYLVVRVYSTALSVLSDMSWMTVG